MDTTTGLNLTTIVGVVVVLAILSFVFGFGGFKIPFLG